MKNIIILIAMGCFAVGINTRLAAQGCVAIRSSAGCAAGLGGGAILMPGESSIGLNLRYFHSFRHFRGRKEEKERVEKGTQVINDSYFADLSFTYAFAPRFYASFALPFVYHERSSMYEHGGNTLRDRHTTYAKGLADIRISAGYWLLSEEEHPTRNVAVALGLKLPTGAYDAKGKFYNAGPNGEPEIRPVDQSIQPGDGGLGFTVDLQGYQQLGKRFILNGNFYYLINPKEHNGTRRRPGADPYASPDQYAVRLDAAYMTALNGLTASLGGRIEGVPVYDVLGSSDAYRRPGYAISIEPGITYQMKRLLFNMSIPIAIERNRTQSYLDKQKERETGEPQHGDAAFADYVLNVGLAYRLHKRDKKMDVFNHKDQSIHE